ncbi:lipopolysaccharide biosynthesis protein [Fumia xinanensis]|uniref:Sugar translocase n=1 Tax=Fumia xinanensis TaxID=2763659 RepID=A0A926E329_9FIRM|nr:hypothetical protein [Fumia xinanensis]MBC8560142.1 sugar translocase [Fumia xinanensis]
MRTENSIRNSAFALGGQFVSLLTGFIMRTVFVHTLGDDYLGLNGLFTSILSMLSLTELGLGTAVSFALYKPLAENDEPKIGALMHFYKKAYQLIALLTAAFGLLLLPFLDAITNGVSDTVPHLTIIYLLFLGNTVLSYFFSYKRTLITAHQKHYLNTINESLFMFIQYVIQMAVLLTTYNYVLYLVVQMGCVFCSNLLISRKVDKMYPYLKRYKGERLDGETRSMMKTNIVSMMFHRVGSVAVTGTDNIIIAQISMAVLGLYSNYTLIIGTIRTVLSQVFNAVTASVGNLIAVESRERQYEIYKNINFVNFWIFGFFTVALGQTVEPFIALCFGGERLLSQGVLYISLINFYLNGMRLSSVLVINAAGLFKQVKYKSFIEAIVNLGVSLFFLIVLKWGIYGVLLGTTVSFLTTNLWWEPYSIYRCAFKEPLRKYFTSYAVYAVVTLGAYLLADFLCGFITLGGWLGWILVGIVSSLVSNALFFLLFFRTREFGYFKEICLRYGHKISNRLTRKGE